MPTILPLTKVSERLGQIIRQAQRRREPIFITEEQPFWYATAQASLGRVWDHPDEDVYTLADGEPL